MYGKLIHINHQLESISEYYFDAKEQIITERKSLINDRIRIYLYDLKEFKKMHKNSKIENFFNKLTSN